MNIKEGIIKEAISSCYFEEDGTSLICSIKLEQKAEREPMIEVVFPKQEPIEKFEAIKAVVESIFKNNIGSTKILVEFYIIKSTENTFSACINAFSICSVLSGILIEDTLAAETLYINKNTMEVGVNPEDESFPISIACRYYEKKIVQIFHVGSIKTSIFKNIIKILEEKCLEKGKQIEYEIKKAAEKISVDNNINKSLM